MSKLVCCFVGRPLRDFKSKTRISFSSFLSMLIGAVVKDLTSKTTSYAESLILYARDCLKETDLEGKKTTSVAIFRQDVKEFEDLTDYPFRDFISRVQEDIFSDEEIKSLHFCRRGYTRFSI